MIVAAVLTLSLLLGGHAMFGSELFSKDTDATIKKVVSDAGRQKEALRIVGQARDRLEATMKRASKVAKEFQKADESQAAGRDQLQPFLDSLSAERTRGQKETLDSVFDLRSSLTEDDWKAVFAPSKK
jgi:hypothetical protein